MKSQSAPKREGDLTASEQMYPETVDWNRLSTVACTTTAWRICEAIADDLDTPDRNLTPGLRRALLLMEDTDSSRRGERGTE